MTRIEALVKLPVGIKIATELFGQLRLSAESEGYLFDIALPDADGWRFDLPDGLEWVQPVAEADGFGARGLDAGPHNSWIICNFLIVRGDYLSDDIEYYNKAPQIGHAFDAWAERWVEWLAAWNSEQLFAPNFLESPRGHVAFYDDDGARHISGWGGTLGSVLISFTPANTEVKLRAAADLSNAGLTPGPEWTLYLRSGASESVRLQLIDLATSAEVSIESALRATLASKGLAPREIEGVLAPLAGIVQKLDLLEVLRPPERSLSKRVAHQVARPRNAAAHAGVAPDRADLQRARGCVEAVLEQYSPLQRPWL